MSERRHEWTDPHPDHGGVTHWIDENGEWNSEEPIPLDSFERVMSDVAYCEHLAALLDDRRADGWISVSERLPDLYKDVLICDPVCGSDGIFMAFLSAQGWWVSEVENSEEEDDAGGGEWWWTHWRPLPAPPEVG